MPIRPSLAHPHTSAHDSHLRQRALRWIVLALLLGIAATALSWF